MDSNTIKNETKKKFKNLLGINLAKYSSKFLAHIKKHLGHTGTPTNVQNNCIKLSDFSVDISKLFLHREITRKFDPKILSQVFQDQLQLLLPLSLPLNFWLNKTGSEVSPNRPKFTDIIASEAI